MSNYQHVMAFAILLFLSLISSSLCVNTFPSGVPTPSQDVKQAIRRVIETSMAAVQAKSDKFLREVIARRLSDPDLPPYSQICMDQCEDNFVKASDDIRRVMIHIGKKKYDKAIIDVDEVVTEIGTCYECLNEVVGEDYELKAFDDWVDGVTNDCIAQLEKLRQ